VHEVTTAFDFRRPRRALRWLLGESTSSSVRWLIAALLVASAGAFTGVVAKGMLLRDDLDAFNAQPDPLRRQPPVAKLAPEKPLSATQVRAINQVVDRLNFSWPTLLDDLERLTPDKVDLLQIDPQLSAGSVQLLVAADSAEIVLDYVESLGSAESLDEARLTKHERDPQNVTRSDQFTITAQLRPDVAAAAARQEPSRP
jgi:Tfp pilus assembly protein PilN